MKVRWMIYGLVALFVIVPMLLKVHLPVKKVSESTQLVYDYIDRLPEGSVVAISFDYGPSTQPEHRPIAEAILRHCFRRNIKIIGLALWPTGNPLGRRTCRSVAQEMGKTYGRDYVYLGYRAGYSTVALQMGDDIRTVFETDDAGTRTDELPMMAGIRNYDDIDLLVDLAAGDSVEMWIAFAYTKFGQKLAAGVTGVIVSQLYPYIQANQLVGLVPGMLGAAEYEKLIDKPSLGMIGLSIQSFVHILVILVIVVGNIEYLMSRRREGR